MITLKCDRCLREVAWYLTDHLPKDWDSYEGKEMCERCAREFSKFRAGVDDVADASIRAYFAQRVEEVKED